MQTPPPPMQASHPRTAGIAIASLVLGILSVTCLSILAGIPALILGALAMQRIGRSAGTLGGQGQALAGVIMGGISFALLPFTLGFSAGLILPAIVSARAKACEAQCLNNVQQCTLACEKYALEHDATWPQSWAEVKNHLGGDPSAEKLLHCPEEPGTAVSYEILRPDKRAAAIGPPNETVVVREINAPHRGKRAVGFADGHVELRADK